MDKTIQNIQPNAIIIGAGITGCTIANLLSNEGLKILLIDKRKEIGGNCADSKTDNYYVHKYGPHIFHTSDNKVWNYLNKFVSFNNFINSPLVISKENPETYYNLPFNMNLFSKFFNEYDPNKIKEIIQKDIDESCKKFNIDKENPKNLEEQAISLVGYQIYYNFIKFYTEKQWGKSCTELDKNIIKRLPLRYVYNNNYFNDRYQGVPNEGYTNMMKKMINSPNIYFVHETNYKKYEKIIDKYSTENNVPIIYTGPIDELFDYKYGNLEWRTVKFENKTKPVANFIGNAVLNYATDSKLPTRIIEHKHFSCLSNEDIYKYNRTVVSEEFSIEWKPGMEPYYPIQNPQNSEKLKKYQELAKSKKHLYLIGRLAEYKYKDMAPSISDAFNLVSILKQRYFYI